MPNNKTPKKSSTRVASLIASLLFFFIFLVMVYVDGIFFIDTNTPAVTIDDTSEGIRKVYHLLSTGILWLSIIPLVLSILATIIFSKSKKPPKDRI